jgi:hypothetical protein
LETWCQNNQGFLMAIHHEKKKTWIFLVHKNIAT